MTTLVTAAIHFTDRTSITLQWPRGSGNDVATITSNVRQALEAESLVALVGDDLLVVPMRSVKYVHVSPAPPALPAHVIRGARLDGGTGGDD
ncbi:MAG TPA: hypothetical protein VLC71_11960 [Thermomonas sp.]|nr:hypothetical protein [Thermomonas sp.]